MTPDQVWSIQTMHPLGFTCDRCGCQFWSGIKKADREVLCGPCHKSDVDRLPLRRALQGSE